VLLLKFGVYGVEAVGLRPRNLVKRELEGAHVSSGLCENHRISHVLIDRPDKLNSSLAFTANQMIANEDC
jgi:hypothetical protein